jgi:putative oxidoreductase
LEFLNKYQQQAIALLRIVSGLLFLEHGTSKLFHFPIFEMYASVRPTDWPEGYAGILELVLGVLIVIGLFSRIAAFIASGEMAVAYFMAHAPSSFFPLQNRGDSAVLYCFVFFTLAFIGPGSFAINKR